MNQIVWGQNISGSKMIWIFMEFFVLNSFCNEQKKESRFFGLILFPIFYFFKKLGSGVLQGFSHANPCFIKIKITRSGYTSLIFRYFIFDYLSFFSRDFFVLNIKTELF
ncbi:hypothetical protein LIMHP_19605 (plasmid) [Leptospira interrogans serovar Manilae]|nr:hypothetical protein LIMLP_19600 [Leptospira interrogans serovar Manilae]AKP32038.1 hypothetical protein LIMHP_19605 [Leptospira interrogans serovar Manilae]